tara:strand:- start:187 stop:441 length:255 start_codon:yes stop_codon:yes gene_type:complete
MKLDPNAVIKQMTSGDTFYITYYAKKHEAIITRKGTWTKPNTDTKGKHFVSKGNDIFVYWDLEATPNDNGNQWRKATNPMRVRI